MKVLMVGLGSIARKHLAALKQIDPYIEIVALRHSPMGIAQEHDVTFVFSADELINYEFSFAIISNPTIFHKQTIEQLIHLKIPLFIEKPLHIDLSIESLFPVLNEKQIPTYVACNLRFYDCIKFLKKHLGNISPRINEINVYCGSYLPDWRPNVDFRTIYSAQKELGGGVHLDLIHEIDYLYWLFGPPIKTDKILRSNSSLNIDAIDYANYNLQYGGFCANVVLNYFRRDYKRTLEIVFEDDTWLVDLKQNKVYSNNNEIFSSEQTFSQTYIEQLNYFMGNLNASDRMNTIEEAYEVLKICLK